MTAPTRSSGRPSRASRSGSIGALPRPEVLDTGSYHSFSRAPLPRRIHIVGGPGVGKTSMASRLAARTALPLHHLDDIARVGGGNGRVRTPEERAPLLDAILSSDAWIAEGVHLGWTDPFLERADLVVWLDYVSWPRAARHITSRFVRGAWVEMRRRPWRERVARTPNYLRSLRELGGAMLDTRRYYGQTTSHDGGSLQGGAERAASPELESTLDTRAATAAALAPFADKLLHCRDAADLDEVLRRVTGKAGPVR